MTLFLILMVVAGWSFLRAANDKGASWLLVSAISTILALGSLAA